IRSAGHLRGDLFCYPCQCVLLHSYGTGGTMAEAGRLRHADASRPWAHPVTQVRVAIILVTLVGWELLAQSGLLYRDVVPSLGKIGMAIVTLLLSFDYYWNLGVTAAEIGVGLAIGGISGLIVGIVLGGGRLLGRALHPYIYYLGPTPKIFFFPVMIMWFGVGPGSKIAMGVISCFFPIALSVAAGMRQIDKVLIRVGRSFRANAWQMVMK